MDDFYSPVAVFLSSLPVCSYTQWRPFLPGLKYEVIDSAYISLYTGKTIQELLMPRMLLCHASLEGPRRMPLQISASIPSLLSLACPIIRAAVGAGVCPSFTEQEA